MTVAPGRSASSYGDRHGWLPLARPASRAAGDEAVPEGMRPNWLVDPRLAGEASHNPPRGVTVEPLAVPSEEDWTVDRSPIARSIARVYRAQAEW